MCCSSLDPVIKGLERNQFVNCFLYGLERSCLADLVFYVLERNHFPPKLTHGLKRSLTASIFDHVFDSVGIILFSDDSYAVYTRGSWKESTCVSFALFCLMCFWLGSWKESWCTSLWWLLCCLHQGSWKESICITLFCLCWMDGLERTLMQLSCSFVMFCHLFSSNGLERNLWSWYLSCCLWLKQT